MSQQRQFLSILWITPIGSPTSYSFNRDLMNQRGVAMGEEFKGKGVHVALGPMM